MDGRGVTPATGNGDGRAAVLVSLFAKCSPDTVRRGREWYDAAAAIVADIAAETGRTREQVAAVLAITSVDVQLGTNVAMTRRACKNGGRTAGRYPNGQRPKVRAALRSDSPGEYATGPKVSAFYRAVLGDRDALVLDRWALRAAGVREKSPSRTERAQVADAYRTAAAIVGEHVRDMQAALWVHVRETTPRRDGRLVRLADVTS